MRDQHADTIVANISAMFSDIEPCYVSASQAELGDTAGRITWKSALAIAARSSTWIESPIADACDAMRDWAVSTGAWERTEIDAWSSDECLALLAQNIASELRMLGSDDNELEDCVAAYNATDWETKSEYPKGSYCMKGCEAHVEYYTGC